MHRMHAISMHTPWGTVIQPDSIVQQNIRSEYVFVPSVGTKKALPVSNSACVTVLGKDIRI